MPTSQPARDTTATHSRWPAFGAPGGWLTTDHLEACWYRIIDHRSDWSQARLEVIAEPDDEPTEITVVVLPNGYMLPQASAERLGVEAIRISATAPCCAAKREYLGSED